MPRIGVVTPEGLNLRVCARVTSDILDQLPAGERLYVSDLWTADGWVFVTVERTRQSGYVQRKYVDIIVPQLPPIAAPKPRRPPSETQEYCLWAAVVVIAIVVAWLFASVNWRWPI
jgi:Bacterial SH3 domain